MALPASLRLDERGFTYIELASVLLIISVLIMIVVGSYQVSSTLAERVSCQSSIRTVSQALSFWRQANGRWPDELSDVSPGYVSANGLRCPATRQPYSYDPEAGVVYCPVHGP